MRNVYGLVHVVRAVQPVRGWEKDATFTMGSASLKPWLIVGSSLGTSIREFVKPVVLLVAVLPVGRCGV